MAGSGRPGWSPVKNRVEYIKKNRESSCPVCNASVSHEVCQCIIAGATGQDTDFCPKFASADLLRSYVISCPNCGFSAYPSDFKRRYDASDLRVLREELERFRARTPICPHCAQNPYALAAHCYGLLGRGEFFLGWICHRGAWWCRSRGDREGERRFQKQARGHFESSLSRGTYPRLADIPVLTYLIGELNRRLGKCSEAQEWFGLVEDAVVDSEEHAWLLDLTRQQREINSSSIN